MLHSRFDERDSLGEIVAAVGVHPVYLAAEFRIRRFEVERVISTGSRPAFSQNGGRRTGSRRIARRAERQLPSSFGPPSV